MPTDRSQIKTPFQSLRSQTGGQIVGHGAERTRFDGRRWSTSVVCGFRLAWLAPFLARGGKIVLARHTHGVVESSLQSGKEARLLPAACDDLHHEAARFIAQKCRHDLEHGVAESADVQNAKPYTNGTRLFSHVDKSVSIATASPLASILSLWPRPNAALDARLLTAPRMNRKSAFR